MTYNVIPPNIALTGVPVAPTATAGTNTTQIATTAFVTSAVSAVAANTTYNVSKYGAIGNGSSNPASGVYGTLAALQAVYGTTISGVTVALTQELDWLGTQLAINTAVTAGGGIVTSNGSFVYTNANSVSDGSGTLNFPAADIFTTAGTISWQGGGYSQKHSWPNDLGTGKFAVLCGGRTSGSSAGFFQDLNLIGPGVGATLGSSTTNMHGVGTNDRRSMFRMYVSAFKVGINSVGGQYIWIDVILGNQGPNYYDMYWDNPNTANWGNMQFTRVLFQTAMKAAVGVHHAAQVLGSTFEGCFFGTCPYGVFKETNSGVPTISSVITECVFINCQFEGIGNALVCDDRTITTRVAGVIKTDFIKTEFSWSATYKIAAVAANAIFDIEITDDCKIIDPVVVGSWTPGSDSMFNIQNPAGFLIRGAVNNFISNCISASKPMFNANSNFATPAISSSQFENTSGGYWKGFATFAFDATQVAGSVIKQNAGGNSIQSIVCTGATSDFALGVLMYNPTPGTNFVTCIFATEGIVTVKTSGTVTTGQLLRSAAGGLAIAATSNTDATSRLLGVAMTPSASGTCTIKLIGLA